MADKQLTAHSAARGSNDVKGNYYNPPGPINDVPGIVTKKGEWECDFYSGTAEALVAAGLLTGDLFPGQPGRNTTSQAYRPAGVKRQHNNQGWHHVPGYMTVTRTASGKFQIRLTVSQEEQARRQAIRDEDAARRESHAPPRVYTPEQRLAAASTVLGRIVDGVGVEEVQRMLDAFKPRQPRPRASYLQLVVSAAP